MNEEERLIRNATCYPYYYEPQYIVQQKPVLRYVHTILYVLCITYIILSTLRYFYYRRKRPVSAMLTTALGAAIMVTVSLLQPLLDLPSVYLLFPRVFVVPLIGFSMVVRIADYYNRFILAQTLLALAQNGSDDSLHGDPQNRAGDDESSARSQALLAVWTFLKEGNVDNKVVPPRTMDNGQENSVGHNGKASGLGFAETHKVDDERKRNMVTKRAIKLLKFLSSNTFYLLSFMVLAFPFLISYIIGMVNVRCYNLKYLCYSCPRPVFAISAVVGGIIITFGLLFAYLVRKFPDPFGIIKEFRLIAAFAALPALTSFILNTNFEDGFSPYFAFGWIISLSMVSYQIVSIDLQIYIAKRDKSERANRTQSKKITKEHVASRSESRLHPTSVEDINGLSAVDGLEALLSDPQEIRLFEKHLVSELAVETITMYQDCAKFVRQFYDMNENTRRARARRIIQQHVDDDALMQVNLPYKIKIDLIDKVNDPAPIKIALFDESQKEIFTMLLGSYLRYIRTDSYKEAHSNPAAITPTPLFNQPSLRHLG